MLNQTIATDLFADLSIDEQQLLSGGQEEGFSGGFGGSRRYFRLRRCIRRCLRFY